MLRTHSLSLAILLWMFLVPKMSHTQATHHLPRSPKIVSHVSPVQCWSLNLPWTGLTWNGRWCVAILLFGMRDSVKLGGFGGVGGLGAQKPPICHPPNVNEKFPGDIHYSSTTFIQPRTIFHSRMN